MVRTRINLIEGKFLIGNIDDDQLVESGVNPLDVLDLAELILNKATSNQLNDLEPLDCNEWVKEDYRAYGRWLRNLIYEYDSTFDTPTDSIYQRAFELGVGPEPRRINRRFGPLWKFHDELEFPGNYSRGKYDDWTTRDFVEYGKSVIVGLGGRKPVEADFQRWFKKRRGPSPALLRDRIGGIGRLQELLGFPYIADWTEDDYIEYGIKVVLANKNKNITRDIFDALSKLKRGPSTRTIVNHFGMLSKYKEVILREAEVADDLDYIETKRKIIERNILLEKGVLPMELLEDIDTEDKKTFLRHTATYILVDKLFGDEISAAEKIHLCGVQPKNLLKSIRAKKPALTPGYIESRAAMLGLVDEIWPIDDYLVNLKVL